MSSLFFVRSRLKTATGALVNIFFKVVRCSSISSAIIVEVFTTRGLARGTSNYAYKQLMIIIRLGSFCFPKICKIIRLIVGSDLVKLTTFEIERKRNRRILCTLIISYEYCDRMILKKIMTITLVLYCTADRNSDLETDEWQISSDDLETYNL